MKMLSGIVSFGSQSPSRWVRRILILIVEIAALLAVIMAGLAGYMLYRLSHGPMDLDFARTYITRAMGDGRDGLSLSLEGVRASWPHLQGPLTLDLQRIEATRDGQVVARIDDVSIGVAKAPLLIGLIRPERLILRAPRVNFERDEAGQFSMGLMDTDVANLSASTAGGGAAVGWMLIDLLLGKTQPGTVPAILTQINEIEIRDARVRVADHIQGLTWQLNHATLMLRKVDVGVYGSITLDLPGVQHFSIVMTYRRADDILAVRSTFTKVRLPSLLGRALGVHVLRQQDLPLSGEITVEAQLRNPALHDVSVMAQADEGALQISGLPMERVSVRDVNVGLAFRGRDKILDLQHFDFKIGKIPVQIAGQIKGDDSDDFRGDVSAKVPRLNLAELKDLWPEGARHGPLAEWLLRRLSGATLRDIVLTLPVRVDTKERQLTRPAFYPRVNFSFENLHALYHDTLYPVEDAAGTGMFADDTLHLDVQSGRVRDLTIDGGTIDMTDLTKAGAGHATIDLRLQGPLGTVLSYISEPPINLGSKLPFKRDGVKGEGTYTARVSFPTLKDMPAEQVEVDANATLKDVLIPNVMPNVDVAGGPYEVSVADGAVTIKGEGTLAGRRMSADVTQVVTPQPGQVATRANLTVDTDDRLRQAVGADLSFVQGVAPMTLSYTLGADGRGTADVSVDLRPARVVVDALNLEKASGVPGQAKAVIDMRDGAISGAQQVTLNLPDLSVARGGVTFGRVGNEREVVSANLPQITWKQGRLRASYRHDANGRTVDLQGDKIDLAPFLSSSDVKDKSADKPGDKSPANDPAAPRLRFSAKGEWINLDGDSPLKNGELDVELAPGGDLARVEMIGQAGTGPMALRYVPDANGRMTLLLEAQDAGGCLRVLGVYENMVGGSLRLTGAPQGSSARDVQGKLAIRDFAVIKAPALAQLLGAMSLNGLGEQLGNKGIGFSRLEADFAWARDGGKDVMSFKNGRTAGSALGLTFDGDYNRTAKTVNVSGTIIPISGLNTLTSKIPVLGQILTGGSGSALFAATYTIKGPASNPGVMINPLSVLTPGIIRRILFE